MTFNDVDKYTHFIAINFGTSDVGVAYSKDDKHIQIYTSGEWIPGCKVGVKFPATLLLDPYCEFEAFGLKAKNMYDYHNKHVLRYPTKFDDYFFFDCFAMCLYDKKHMLQDMKITAANGKKLPAHVVIAKSLQEIKSRILIDLNKIHCIVVNILWIMTVPVIWSQGAKQILREAVTEAKLGVDKGSSLLYVSESEATAIFCQKDTLDAPQDISNDLTSHYLVVDCGKKTVDIVAYRLTKISGGKISIEEIHEAHSGPHGGCVAEFENMLEKLFQLTRKDMYDLQNKFTDQWITLIEHFECSKQLDPIFPEPITIDLSKKMLSYVKEKTGKKVTKLFEEYVHHKIEYDDDDKTLILPFNTINSLYATTILQIITAIKQVLEMPHCQCVKTIIVIGDLADSKIIFEKVNEEFSPAVIVKRILTSSSPVLEGAIMYGIHQNVIKFRKIGQSVGNGDQPGTDDNTKIKQHKDTIDQPVEIDKNGDVKHPLQCNVVKTIPGGIVWSGVTCSAGLIGYVIGDDVGVFTGALCAILTGVVSIDVLQWGYRTFNAI